MVDDVAGAVRSGFAAVDVPAGASVAVAVGSRGITDLVPAVRATVDALRAAGAVPFVVPAMGSHGGATADGQAAMLASLGVTEAAAGCPVRSSMDVVDLGPSPLGHPLFADRLAAEADHLVLVNRVKPHTTFAGPVESGLLKMLAFGVGKHEGAALLHRASADHGFADVVLGAAPLLVERLGVLAGVALVERGDDRTAAVEVVPGGALAEREPALLALARELLPQLPFAEADLLLVDRIGKDVSGTGVDTNVVGRKAATGDGGVHVRFIAVRGLTTATAGNALGLGFADLCRTRVARGADPATMRVNALASTNLRAAMTPLAFDTDAELLDVALPLSGLRPPERARVQWIRDTRHLEVVACSAAYLDEARERPDLEVVGEPWALPLDRTGNLPDDLPAPDGA